MLIVAGGDPWRTAFSDSPGYAQTTRRIIVSSFTSDKQKIKKKNMVELNQGGITRFK